MTDSTRTNHSTRRRRIAALGTAAAVLLGAGAVGTAALYTDTEVVGANDFTAGSLDLVATPATQLFRVRDMAPGDVVARPLHLTNSGTTPLSWTPSVRVADSGALAEQLATKTFSVATDAACAPGADASGALLSTGGWTDLGQTFRGADDAYLAPGDESVVCLVVGMNYDADRSFAGAVADLQWIFDAEQTDEAAHEPTPEPAPDLSQIMQVTYSTTNPVCSDGNITMPISGTTAGGTIDWGDGTVTPLVDNASHTYATPGERQITVDGQFTKFGNATPGDNQCITSVSRWGEGTGTTTLTGAFNGASELRHVAAIPTTVTALANVMQGPKPLFDNDMSGWNPKPTSLNNAFMNATGFNGDISHWDTSAVRAMTNTFNGARDFNADISSWDTSSVTSMSYAFSNAWAFNADISSWDTSKVTNMSGAFLQARAFNRDLSGWNVSGLSGAPFNFAEGATSWVLPKPIWP